MEEIATYLSMTQKFAKFKTKDPEIVVIPLFLGNIPKDWSVR